MSENDFSQISITHDARLIGSLNETASLCRTGSESRYQRPAGRDDHADGFPIRRRLDAGRSSLQDADAADSAVLVRDFKSDKTFIITMSDVMRVL